MRLFLVLLVLFCCFSSFAAETVVSFDALFSGPGQSIHDTSFSTNAATFINSHDPELGSWSGFAFSTVSNTVDGSWTNQFAAIQAHSNAYAVAYDSGGWDPPPEILFDIPAAPKAARLNNTTYAAFAMRDGSGFNQAFSAGDFLVVKLIAYDLDGRAIATNVHVLADFTGTNAFIQTNWTRLDLSAFGDGAASIQGTVDISDLNAPTYFALADFTYAYSDGSDGIAATNPAILCWADGWSDYRPGPNVEPQWQTPSNATGAAKGSLAGLGSTNGIVSLGDGGSIVLTFPVPISDGPGPDFAVFENAFDDTFLELAHVEVSSDGTNFVRFPNHCLETNSIDTYGLTRATDPTAYGGLAGKHTQGFGTPFDLRCLAGAENLDTRRVTHVKIIDILGDGTTPDTYGNPIYDPTPTWGSGGFDLDAVGVLNANLAISTAPAAPVPALPGFTTVLEHKANLTDTDWTGVESRERPGFYRYRLYKK